MMRPQKKKQHPLNQSALYRLENKRKLAEILLTSYSSLSKIAEGSDGAYSEWDDTNKRGKVRHIENPRAALKKVQARLNKLLGSIEPPEYLTCPVRGRSYVSNAAMHVGSTEIVNLDISTYFQSTSSKRVFWFFRSVMECARDVAGILTALTTFKGHAPTGSPTSPLLAYYAHSDMWNAVAERCKAARCKVTLYMDDLTISGARVPESLVWDVKELIHGVGLRTKKDKERRYRYGGVVTGVYVGASNLSPLNRSHKKLHELRKLAVAEADEQVRAALHKQINGVVGQQRQIAKAGKFAG